MTPDQVIWMWTLTGTLAASGLGVVGYALFRDRSRGRRRCPKCWYDMRGTPGLICPECGRAGRRESDLLRTRRHWRRALLGVLVIGTGVGIPAFQIARAKNPWSLAPDWLVIYALPWHQTGKEPLAKEFLNRQNRFLPRDLRFPRGYAGHGSLVAEFVTLDFRVVGDVSPRRQRLLADRALAGLERNTAHPLRLTLLGVLTALPADAARAEALLVPMVEDPTWEVRAAAVRALGRSRASPERVIPVLVARIEALAWPMGYSSEAELALLVEAIGSYGADAAEAVPVLVRFLKERVHPEYDGAPSEITRYFCEALSDLGPAAAAAADTLVIRSEDWNAHVFDSPVRLQAHLIVTGAAKDRFDALLQLTHHPSWRMRRAAIAQLLYRSPDNPAHVQRAVEMFDDPSDIPAIATAEALLGKGLAREQCREFLLKSAADGGAGTAWTRVQLLQRYDFDATPLIPQLEAEIAGLTNPTAVQNYRNMIDALKRGERYPLR